MAAVRATAQSVGGTVKPKDREQEIIDLVIVVFMSSISGWAVSRGFPIWAFPSSLVGGFLLILAWRGFTK